MKSCMRKLATPSCARNFSAWTRKRSELRTLQTGRVESRQKFCEGGTSQYRVPIKHTHCQRTWKLPNCVEPIMNVVDGWRCLQCIHSPSTSKVWRWIATMEKNARNNKRLDRDSAQVDDQPGMSRWASTMCRVNQAVLGRCLILIKKDNARSARQPGSVFLVQLNLWFLVLRG